MTARRRRRIRFAVAALAVVATVAACGGEKRPAALVGGTEITSQEVVDELEAIRANEGYLETIEAAGEPVLGQEEGTFDSAFVATQLAIRIQYAIVANEVERRGLDADTECQAAARDLVVRQIGEDNLAGFPESYQDYLVRRETDILLLQGDLVEQPCVADAAVDDYYEEHRDEFTEACGVHILVGTPQETEEIIALLGGGADFAALASERSTDLQSGAQGGVLPCVRPGEFIAELDEALFAQPVGAIGAPVQTSFGFHVIRVESRRTPPLSEIRDEVRISLGNEVQTAFRAWFEAALADASVTVDPRYGRWDRTIAGIIRPGAGSPAP